MSRAFPARTRLALALILALAVAGIGCSSNEEGDPASRFHPGLTELVSPELLASANRGREVLKPDGTFAFPKGVERVWIDVGAHHLETTRKGFLAERSVGMIGVEPIIGAFEHWPNTARLIGLPIALSYERGEMDFHINVHELGSSLLETVPNKELPLADLANKTVEIRKVPVLRLEDVMERIPADLPIEYLKVDVQGLDLQVLKSAGDHIRRVEKIRTEVTNSEFYKGEGENRRGTEAEFDEYLVSHGFRFQREFGIGPGRAWVDKIYLNTRPPSER